MKKICNLFKNVFQNPKEFSVIANEKIDASKLKKAQDIIVQLQNEIEKVTECGSGPFIAAVYDENDNLLVKVANSVVNDNCSNNHAEMMAIKKVQELFNTYDLSKYNLKIVKTMDRCMFS